jgi:hypothetical protein
MDEPVPRDAQTITQPGNRRRSARALNSGALRQMSRCSPKGERGPSPPHTDHLSDRELYALLWSDILHDEVPLLPDDPGVWHIDLLGRGDETDTMLYLKYYADESERQQWLKDYGDCGLSPHEEPPFDRDRHLPKPYESQQ